MKEYDEAREKLHGILSRHTKATLAQGKYLDGCSQLVTDEILSLRGDRWQVALIDKTTYQIYGNVKDLILWTAEDNGVTGAHPT